MPYLNNARSGCGGLGPWVGGCGCGYGYGYGGYGGYGYGGCNGRNRHFWRTIGGNRYGVEQPYNDLGCYYDFVMHSPSRYGRY